MGDARWPQDVGVVFLGAERDELGEAVASSFALNGCSVTPLLVDKLWPECLDLIVIYGPFRPLSGVIKRVMDRQDDSEVVVWYTEGMPSPALPSWFVNLAAFMRWHLDWYTERSAWFKCVASLPPFAMIRGRGARFRIIGELKWLHMHRKLRLLAVISRLRDAFCAKLALPSVFIPMGYHPTFGRTMNLQRDIDVVFLGSTRDYRRRAIISELEAKLAKAGIRFVVRDGSARYGYVWGNERAELLNRSLIMLNIMRESWDCPTFRILLAAPNRAMVLSEPTDDVGLFEPGRHFAIAPLEEMVDVICYYLKHPEERMRIADTAYEFVTGQLAMENMAARILDEVRQSVDRTDS